MRHMPERRPCTTAKSAAPLFIDRSPPAGLRGKKTSAACHSGASCYGFSSASARIAAAMSLLTVASARLCAAASASKPSPCTVSRRDRAARARLPAGGLAHRPHRVDQRRLTANRLEALDVDSDPIVRIEVRKRRSGHVRCPELHREVAGDGARDAVVERRGPAIEFVDVDAVGRDLDHELRLIDRGGNGDRTDHDRRAAGRRAPSAVAVESSV